MRRRIPSIQNSKWKQKCIISSAIKNQNIEKLLELLDKRHKNLDAIHKISYYLEQVLQFSYFKLLRAHLTELDYLTIIEKLTVEYYEQRSIIVEKRKKNEFFYIILWGEVLVLDQIEIEKQKQIDKENRESRENKKFEVINKLEPGGTFGESSLVSVKHEAMARVQARTPVILMVLDFDIFSKTAMKITIIKRQEIVTIFSRSSLFYNINQDHIKDLAVQIYETKVKLNEVIYLPGSKHDSFYFVKSGLVELQQNNVKLVALGTGQTFGVEFQSLADESRYQLAVCRSNDVVLYKIAFVQLKALQSDYDKFLQNLVCDFVSKKKIYLALLSNSRKVEKLITSNSLNVLKRVKKGKSKKLRIQKVPEWWGTVDRDTGNKLQKYRYQTFEKQNLRPSGLLGTIRISQLKQLAIKLRSQPDEQQQLSSLYFGQLKGVLPKKTLNMNIHNQELVRKKVIPAIKKQKLLNYAKSGTDFCQNIFVPYYLMNQSTNN